MPLSELDHRVRLSAFDWLRKQMVQHGDVLSRSLLSRGYVFEDQRVPLLGPQGIFKPKVLPEIPLSITTSPDSPYHDHFGRGDLLRYAYRGTDPHHRDNVGLRRAMARRIPLVYFHGVMKGKYLAAWPVYVVGDDPGELFFTVALDDAQHIGAGLLEDTVADRQAGDEGRRAYITSTFKRRLHQERFRERVLRAYREQCALCCLRHEELLDAAHIIADSDEEGEPVVQNGLALCKLHHAAFDSCFLAVRPDYIIEVRHDVLDEEDGPMLLHGLKGMHRRKIELPHSRREHPDPARLEIRYKKFLDMVS